MSLEKPGHPGIGISTAMIFATGKLARSSALGADEVRHRDGDGARRAGSSRRRERRTLRQLRAHRGGMARRAKLSRRSTSRMFSDGARRLGTARFTLYMS